MSYELKMKLLMHLVCIVQWGVFALIHWEMLGKGKWKHPFACTALALCGMLVISLWIDFGFFNAASIAFNVAVPAGDIGVFWRDHPPEADVLHDQRRGLPADGKYSHISLYLYRSGSACAGDPAAAGRSAHGSRRCS